MPLNFRTGSMKRGRNKKTGEVGYKLSKYTPTYLPTYIQEGKVDCKSIGHIFPIPDLQLSVV